MKDNLRIGITLGDPRGIGAEVILKSLKEYKERFAGEIYFRLYGTERALRDAESFTGIKIYDLNLISCSNEIDSIRKAASDVLSKEIDAIITGPVNKKSIRKTLHYFSGHTEYLARLAGVPKTVMMFVTDDYKVIQATTHIPLKNVSKKLTENLLNEVIECSIKSFKLLWMINNPKIAICGLNPHAGEEGEFGEEEIKVISPVIGRWQSKGYNIIGPFGADTVLTSAKKKLYDAVIAIYHDQLLPAIKLVSKLQAVNLTLGLPFIRTSPDHGTAYDIYGKNEADHLSMLRAVELAIELTKNRRKHES